MVFDVAGTLRARVKWYFAAPGAGYLPYDAHLFCSSVWDSTGVIPLGPGEAWDSPHVYTRGSLPGPLYGRGTPCGPADWWQNGVPSDAPRLVLGPDGLPSCCPRGPFHQAGVKVGAQVLSICQPFFTTSHGFPLRSLASANPSLSFVLDNISLTHTKWFDFSPLNVTIDATAGAINTCGAQRKSVVTIQAPGGGIPLAVPMQLAGYNAATFTGTWVIPASVPNTMPGFQVFVTLPS